VPRVASSLNEPPDFEAALFHDSEGSLLFFPREKQAEMMKVSNPGNDQKRRRLPIRRQPVFRPSILSGAYALPLRK